MFLLALEKLLQTEILGIFQWFFFFQWLKNLTCHESKQLPTGKKRHHSAAPVLVQRPNMLLSRVVFSKASRLPFVLNYNGFGEKWELLVSLPLLTWLHSLQHLGHLLVISRWKSYFITCPSDLPPSTLDRLGLLFGTPCTLTSCILTSAPASCWKLHTNHSPTGRMGKGRAPGPWHNASYSLRQRPRSCLHSVLSTKQVTYQHYHFSSSINVLNLFTLAFLIAPRWVCVCFSGCASYCYPTHKTAVTSLWCSGPSATSVSSPSSTRP